MFGKIAPDKKKHFFVGIPLGVFLQLFTSLYFYNSPGYALLSSFAFLCAICYGFELFSKITGRGHADNMDAIAGILGGIIGIGLYYSFLFFIR